VAPEYESSRQLVPKGEEMDELSRLSRDVRMGRVSRRDFIRQAALLGVSASALPVLLGACGETGGGQSDSGAQLTIGLSLPTLDQRRWQFDKRYVEQETQRLGHQLIVESAEDDEQLQIDQVENMVSQAIDALILSPFNVETASPAVSTAKEAGIPVLAYNSVVLNADLDWWVARDNIKVGEMQARMAVKDVPEGNYLIASGEPGVDIAQEKTQGNMNVLQPLIDEGKINLVSQEYHRGWDPALGLKQIEAGLQRTSNKIDAILANYDGYLLPAQEALSEVGLLGKTWLGGEDVFVEVAQAIVRGDVAMSAFTPLREMATKAVQTAVTLAEGKDPETNDTIDNGFAKIPGLRVEAFAVTKQNMCEFLKDTKWLAADNVYKDIPKNKRPTC
jgi:D-xylose transport system substrate-binding protein